MRFRREGERTTFEVLEKNGRLRVLRQPSPWSLTATAGERLMDVVASAVGG